MINRINQKMIHCKANKEKALACFLTAGYPAPDKLLSLVDAIEKGGADIIELGMPFSDPLADGPMIQYSSRIALQKGVTLDWIFSQVRLIRSKSEIPIILMGYINPILAFGAAKFFKTASRAGVDGVIIPEIPLEESGRFSELIKENKLANILLVTPTTLPDRIAAIDKQSNGFLYCVSTTGVTGLVKKRIDTKYLKVVKSSAKENPVLVGFGIRTSEDARRVASSVDGVIIGSALIEKIRKGKSLKDVENYVRGIKASMKLQ